MAGDRREDPRLVDVALLAVGVGGLALCITLVYLGMRAVMDVGGACADGGPYVSAQPCPDGAPGGLMLGVFGLFAFGGLGAVYGSKVGGWGWVPLLAWTGLFASLGWNFLEYGLFDSPTGEVVWGWLIPGILFQLMAWVPIVFLVGAWREVSRMPSRSYRSKSSRGDEASPMPGPGQPPGRRPPPVPAAHRVEVVGPVRGEALAEIDALMGALIVDAAADAPVDPDRRDAVVAAAQAPADGDAAPAGGEANSGGTEAFSEGTQALLDRLERLADMRDRGLLTPDEYETAKATIVQELEARA